MQIPRYSRFKIVYQLSTCGFWESQAVRAIAITVFVVVITWAMAVNTHFEKTVRIQSDRHHRVIESGFYRVTIEIA